MPALLIRRVKEEKQGERNCCPKKLETRLEIYRVRNLAEGNKENACFFPCWCMLAPLKFPDFLKGMSSFNKARELPKLASRKAIMCI